MKKTLLRKVGEYSIYLVRGEDIRSTSLSDEEFTNFGIHDDIKDIPEDEIWVSEEMPDNAREFYIDSALYRLSLLHRGVDSKKAYQRSLQWEKEHRVKIFGPQDPGGKKKEVYLSLVKTLPGKPKLKVYLVDTEKVRSRYKIDFVEGGHGYVYPWIPKDEIWIDNEIHESEFPYIIEHELVELKLMRDWGMQYEKAHRVAAKAEFEQREKRLLEK